MLVLEKALESFLEEGDVFHIATFVADSGYSLHEVQVMGWEGSILWKSLPISRFWWISFDKAPWYLGDLGEVQP